MNSRCSTHGCQRPDDGHGHSSWHWYDREGREERAARRRQKRARFGEPPPKTDPRPERVVNFERSDREDIPLGSGDCPECGGHVPLGSAKMRGWRGPLCGCGWRGKPIDYREESDE